MVQERFYYLMINKGILRLLLCYNLTSVFVDHMEYVRDLIGVEYIGIGSDFDGTSS